METKNMNDLWTRKRIESLHDELQEILQKYARAHIEVIKARSRLQEVEVLMDIQSKRLGRMVEILERE